MSKFERLTARSQKNNMAYLANVKSNEQEIEGAYNTLMCIKDSWERLAQYEDSGLSPSEVAELAKSKEEGRLVILPSKSDEIIRIVELALKIKLYDWQKAYITGDSGYSMPGRVSGKTTA